MLTEGLVHGFEYRPGRVQIDDMSLLDIPAVLEIERSSHLEPWREEFFLEELDRPYSRVLVARIADRSPDPLGYTCFWRVADEIHILNLAVHWEYRRQGIGRCLMQFALREGYRGQARLAVLEVRRSNLAARNLYESLGFRPIAERPNYYGGVPEPAFIMEVELNESCKVLKGPCNE